MMKVTTKYTIEDCVFVADYINKRNKYSSNFWTQLYYYFIFLNCFAFSAFSFFLEYYLFGTLIFIINLIFLLFLGDKIQSESYKAFYRSFFGNEDSKEAEIELNEEGISFNSNEGNTFYYWQNIIEILETPKVVYFFTRANGFSIPKDSFEFESQMQEFLIFSKVRVPQYILK